MTDILTYDLIDIDIFIRNLFTIAILYLVYNLTFIDMFNQTSVDALNNTYKCIGFV